ncbi:unnamed protein product [Durusdinium trenchii]|uniref:Uncharacterized protein n=1 Tax=Durusdinium trenchii TaxID=1381693 RepID=A0ABP0PMH9_9DINO
MATERWKTALRVDSADRLEEAWIAIDFSIGEDEILRHLADLPPDRPSTPLGYELEDHRVRHARWNTAFVAEARTGQSPDILKATRGFLEFDAITKVTEALQTLCDEQLAGRCQTHSVAYQETFFSEDDYLPCGESQPSWTSTLQLWQHEALCSRQKGKPKGKGIGNPSPVVNTYNSELYAALPFNKGLFNSGATASAAPQETLEALEGLIQAALKQDRSAHVDVAQNERPLLRFGSGKWGHALYRVRITSNASGEPGTFAVFSLPNPAEYHHPDFDKTTLARVFSDDHLLKTMEYKSWNYNPLSLKEEGDAWLDHQRGTDLQRLRTMNPNDPGETLCAAFRSCCTIPMEDDEEYTPSLGPPEEEDPTSAAEPPGPNELDLKRLTLLKEAHQEVTDLNIYEALLDLSFLVRKINAAEVNLKRLTPIEQALFRFAKGKEVNSFIKNIAVHKCLNDEEVRQAYTSGRIVRARWVLTWKAIPPDERALAAKEALEEGTVAHPDGTKKAKADEELWTTGVAELEEALQVPQNAMLPQLEHEVIGLTFIAPWKSAEQRTPTLMAWLTFKLILNAFEVKDSSQARRSMNATLGGLQWLATQPQLNARRNLLISELLTDSTLQSMVMEVRRDHYTLEYFRIPTAATWADLVFITFGDQAHNNRPKGDSTGGMITTLAGPECKDGHVCKMMLLQWKTWKLRRKGALVRSTVVDTFDKVSEKIWLSSKLDWWQRSKPLSFETVSKGSARNFDGWRRTMTKKKADCRDGLETFMKTGKRRIRFDPEFNSYRRNKKSGHTASKR